jgi:hypothetical protein
VRGVRWGVESSRVASSRVESRRVESSRAMLSSHVQYLLEDGEVEEGEEAVDEGDGEELDGIVTLMDGTRAVVLRR